VEAAVAVEGAEVAKEAVCAGDGRDAFPPLWDLWRAREEAERGAEVLRGGACEGECEGECACECAYAARVAAGREVLRGGACEGACEGEGEADARAVAGRLKWVDGAPRAGRAAAVGGEEACSDGARGGSGAGVSQLPSAASGGCRVAGASDLGSAPERHACWRSAKPAQWPHSAPSCTHGLSSGPTSSARARAASAAASLPKVALRRSGLSSAGRRGEARRRAWCARLYLRQRSSWPTQAVASPRVRQRA
jgi:hypothetical protein